MLVQGYVKDPKGSSMPCHNSMVLPNFYGVVAGRNRLGMKS